MGDEHPSAYELVDIQASHSYLHTDRWTSNPLTAAAELARLAKLLQTATEYLIILSLFTQSWSVS